MRIINVITVKNGVVNEMFSFAIHEEQLSNEVVEKAEEKFEEVARKMGATDDNIEQALEDGYYENDEPKSVSIVWSYVND